MTLLAIGGSVALGIMASDLARWAVRYAFARFESWRFRRQYGLKPGERIGQIVNSQLAGGQLAGVTLKEVESQGKAFKGCR